MRYLPTDCLRWSLALLFLLLLAAPLRAQEDLRISPFEPPHYILPVDIQIQSGATVSDTTLVVWGTRIPGPDSAVNGLVMQRIVRQASVGVPEVIHSSQARPYGVVSVVGLDDRFVLLWNDRRITAPGIYLRRVALDGSFIGQEELMVAGGHLNSDTTLYLERTSGGYRMIWRDTSMVLPVLPNNAYYFIQEFNTTGGLIGGTSRTGLVNFDDTLEYSAYPGMKIVRRTDGSGVLHHQDGRIDARTIPIGRLNRPFHLDNDTTIVVMEGDPSGNRRVAFHHSLFDTIAYRQVPLPKAGFAQLLHAGAIGRDSSGRTVVIFGSASSLGVIIPVGYIGTILQRAVIDDTDTLKELTVFDTAYGGSGVSSASYYRTTEFTKESYISGDENWATATAVFHTEQHNKSGTWSQSDNVSRWMFNGNAEWITDIESTLNDIRSRFNPIRGVAGDKSRVVISYGSNLVVLTADIASLVPQVDRQRPIIIERGGKLMATWDRVGTIPTYELVRIDRFDTTGIIPLPTLRPDPRGSWREVNGVHERWSNLTSTLSEGNGAVSVLASSNGGTKDQYGQGLYTWFAAYVAVDTGWVKVVYHTHVLPFLHNNMRLLYDPVTKHLTLSELKQTLGISLSIVYSIDFNGQVRWTKSGFDMPSRSGPVWLVGSDSSDYHLANQDSIYRLQNGVASSVHVFPKALPKSVRYYRLLGDGLLRVTPTDSLRSDGTLRDSTLTLEIHGLEGQRSGSYTMRLPSADYRIAFAERPADGSIFFLFGADDGLHITVLDRNLRPRVVDLLLAPRALPVRNPSVLLRGDTLYVVWQDKRDGVDAIFVNRWVMEGTLPVQPPDIKVMPGTPDITIGTLRPNPAVDYVLMRVELAETPSMQIEIVDALGRLVRHEDRGGYAAGTWDIALNLASLHPGVYTIILRTPNGASTTRVVIFR